MIELSASDENYFCWASPSTSLGRAWPALRVFTSHLEMKHHHVFIIKHSHSHIATHEDVPRPNSDQITCRDGHFIWLKKTQDLSKSFLLMSGTKCDLWFLNYILIYFFVCLAVSRLTPGRPQYNICNCFMASNETHFMGDNFQVNH